MKEEMKQNISSSHKSQVQGVSIICLDEAEKESTHWISDIKSKFSDNVISKATHLMRNKLTDIVMQLDLHGPKAVLFGGLVRRSILSSSLIKKHLGDKLDSEEDRHVQWAAIESVKVPIDTFVDLKADIDIYIDTHDTNIVGALVESIKEASYDVRIVNKVHNYGGCTRLNVRTHAHPLAPHICVQVDVVTPYSSEGPMFPDFTCNQLAVSTEGELQIFKTSSMPSNLWWNVQHYDKFVSSENKTTGSSFAAGELDERFSVIEDIRAQVKRKEGHVLMYKFLAWSECRAENNVSSSRSDYLKYVSKIVCYRLPRLMVGDWKLLGFACELAPDGLRCKENKITGFRDMRFGFEYDVTDEPSYYCVGCEKWHDIVVTFVD